MQQILDFFLPSPSLSTVSSVHTTRRDGAVEVDVVAETEAEGRRRRIPSVSDRVGGEVSVMVREEPAAAEADEAGLCELLIV